MSGVSKRLILTKPSNIKAVNLLRKLIPFSSWASSIKSKNLLNSKLVLIFSRQIYFSSSSTLLYFARAWKRELTTKLYTTKMEIRWSWSERRPSIKKTIWMICFKNLKKNKKNKWNGQKVSLLRALTTTLSFPPISARKSKKISNNLLKW